MVYPYGSALIVIINGIDSELLYNNHMKKSKVVKKPNKPDKLAHEMATEVASMTKYIGLDDPSNISITDMDYILDSFLDKKRAEVILKEINKMTYSDVIKLKDKVDTLLESGKYD